MSIDQRTRMFKDMAFIPTERVVEEVLVEALAAHGDLAGRGASATEARPLGFHVGDQEFTLREVSGRLSLESGLTQAEVVAELDEEALSDLVQDSQSTTGLAMTARVRISLGKMDDLMRWEPVLRALLDGRRVYEPGDVTFLDLEGKPLDLDRKFTLDDDHEEIAHFLREAGFLHLRGLFDAAEMEAVGKDIDHFIARAKSDDGDSWWAEDTDGNAQPVRVLNFYEKSEALRDLVQDERYQAIGRFSGDNHAHRHTAEGLVKPLGIVRGLSDLPWHKDCGQGRHSYMCNALTCGISVTGADRVSGALGVVPGSHRANVKTPGREALRDLASRKLETETGDVTVHCSDTLHRAYPPTERPRKVVYSGFSLPLQPGDHLRDDPRYSREARAALSNVQDRLDATDADATR